MLHGEQNHSAQVKKIHILIKCFGACKHTSFQITLFSVKVESLIRLMSVRVMKDCACKNSYCNLLILRISLSFVLNVKGICFVVDQLNLTYSSWWYLGHIIDILWCKTGLISLPLSLRHMPCMVQQIWSMECRKYIRMRKEKKTTDWLVAAVVPILPFFSGHQYSQYEISAYETTADII